MEFTFIYKTHPGHPSPSEEMQLSFLDGWEKMRSYILFDFLPLKTANSKMLGNAIYPITLVCGTCFNFVFCYKDNKKNSYLPFPYKISIHTLCNLKFYVIEFFKHDPEFLQCSLCLESFVPVYNVF